MKKLAMIFALALGACASIQNPVSRNQLYGIEASYGLALSGAVAYRSLPLCQRDQSSTIYNVCAQRSVILQLQAADRKAQIAIDQANDFVKEYPTLNAAEAIQIAAKAVTAFSQIETSNNIR
jgi:hypothetical protein